MERYGKAIDFRNLARGLDTIQEMIQSKKAFAKQYVTEDYCRAECSVCHQGQHIPFVTIDGYRYVQCEQCGSLYLENLPDVYALYTTEETQQGEMYLDEDTFLKRVEQIAVPKIRFVLEALHEVGVSEVKQWVDIGCGVGELLVGLRKVHPEIQAIGIESDPRELAFGRKQNCRIEEGFISSQNADERLLDLITGSTVVSMFNVLEHMEHPDQVIQLIADAMSPGALLVIEVPRHPSVASYANLTSNEYVYRHITPPIHLQIFSDEGIKLLTKDKFEIVSHWGFGQGFSDVLLNALLKAANPKDSAVRQMYEQLVSIANEVQPSIDKAGWADQTIYVCMKR